MKNRLITVFVMLAIVIGSRTSFAAGEKILMGTFSIPFLVIDADHGVFVELTKAIAQRANLDIEISIYPPKRTMYQFQSHALDGLFPGLDTLFSPGDTWTRTAEVFFVKKDYIFTLKGTPMLKTLKDLEGKRVGVTFGYPYAQELMKNPLIQVENAPSDEMNAQKLAAKRIDAFIVEEVAGIAAFRIAKILSDIQYDAATPIAQQDVYYAFQNTEKGKQLEAIFSATLREMKQDGTYAKILGTSVSQP